MEWNRRDALTFALLGSGAAMVPGARVAAAAAPFRPAPIRWIDGSAPALHVGQTFGVAWPRSAVKRGTALTVTDRNGDAVPSQTWITANWPDGSIKWSAHAVPADVVADSLIVSRGRPTAPRGAGDGGCRYGNDHRR